VEDRSFRAFLRAAWEEPGRSLRLLSVLAFGLALGLRKGVIALVVALSAGAIIGCVVGYPYFRRRGRLLGGVRRPGP